jgi:endothelin-converting enzyme/putative endopeptidase
VNAYYNPPNNEMVFPAGILQPPFFDPSYPMAMNFGGIGMVMGHELTHGFDDQGRKFDGQGRLRQWWEAQAVERFETQATCVEKLYDGYEVQPGLTLNGKLTLGENIADLGGIKQAHSAYVGWAKGREIGELTREQLFFVAFGQLWCTTSTPEIERVLALTDTHSHSRYRVNGPLSNLPAFWDAFACTEGEPMRPRNTCEVW